MLQFLRNLFVVLFLFASLAAQAATPREEAQIQVYFTDRFLQVAVEHCRHEPAHPALLEISNRFRRSLGDNIEAGRDVGRVLAARRGGTVEADADLLARQAIEKLGRAGSRREHCALLARDVDSQLGWSIEHYLQLGFAEVVRQAGNAAGYPCEWLRDRVDRTVLGFTQAPLDFSEDTFLQRASLLSEAERVLKLIASCERAQARAPEFGIPEVENHGPAKAALSSITQALTGVGADRNETLSAARDKLRSYPRAEVSR